MFAVEFDADALDELDVLRSADRVRIVSEVRRHLVHDAVVPSRKRKMLVGARPTWNQVGPVWQLRVGDFRVFYDVLDDKRLVIVRAVRKKEARTTKEIL